MSHCFFLSESETPKETLSVMNPAKNAEETEKLKNYFKTAIADEYLAAFQYRQEMNVSKGNGKADIDPELEQHYKEEMEHAEKLEERLKQIGGRTIGPLDWQDNCRAGYIEPPENGDCIKILEDSISGERKAILFYKEFIKFVKEIEDEATVSILKPILKDEEEHLYDLEQLRLQLTDE